MLQLTAKPLEWKEEKTAGTHGWNDTRMGFWIDHDHDHDDDGSGEPYSAGWGEGDSETFATLDEAKQWCQEQADSFIRECGQAEAVAV